MKKLITIAVLALVSVAAFAQTSKDIYNKYSDDKDISAVYISSAMFKMIKALPDMNVNGEKVNLSESVASLEGMYILNITNPQRCAALRSDAEKLLKAGKYEMLLEAKDSGDATRIYTIEKNGYITDLVLLSAEPNETTFISLTGKIKSEDLAKILND